MGVGSQYGIGGFKEVGNRVAIRALLVKRKTWF
jgi:hypothetical protein